jgi:hypothetical protein
VEVPEKLSMSTTNIENKSKLFRRQPGAITINSSIHSCPLVEDSKKGWRGISAKPEEETQQGNRIYLPNMVMEGNRSMLTVKNFFINLEQ